MRPSRVAVVSGVFLWLGVTAASAAEKGQFGIHLGATHSFNSSYDQDWLSPDLSLSYQFSKRLSLRPSLSLGHSSADGWSYGIGGTALYHLRPGRRVAPFLGLGLRYDDHGPVPDLTGLGLGDFPPDLSSRRYTTFSAIAGTEYTLTRRLSVFAEVEGRYATGRHYRRTGEQFHLGTGAFRIRPVVGLTLKLR
jgi:hypothetical protein